jgi:hypothetical protein
MAVKVITKRINDGLNNFLLKDNEIEQSSQIAVEQSIPQNKKTLKRNDGLIERVDIGQKMYIAEDNRQLLND